jgi:hypothetical protein
MAGRFFSLGTQASAAGSVIAKWRHSVSSGRCRCVGSRLLQLFVAVVVRFHGKNSVFTQALIVRLCRCRDTGIDRLLILAVVPTLRPSDNLVVLCWTTVSSSSFVAVMLFYEDGGGWFRRG